MINRTTIRLSITRGQLAIARIRAWLAQRDPLAVLAAPTLLLVAMGALLRILLLQSTPRMAAQPTPPLPIIMIATAPAVAPPTAAPAAQVAAVAPNTLRRAVVAYDAPAGSVLGAIEQGRAYQVLARYGADWLQAEVAGSGIVWLRADQVLDLPADLANLQPTAAPQIVYEVVNQPVQAAQEAAPAAAPEIEAVPTPAPPSQVLSERERNIQQHYVEIPTRAPMEQDSVTQEWARVQWAAEHPQP